MNLLDQILDSTEEVETPRSYIFWSVLAAVSSLIKRNIYFDKFYYKVYCNIYVLIVGKSGLRKSYAINKIAKGLVEQVNNTRIISGRNSIQGIIKELSTATTMPNGGAPLLDACAACFSEEFYNLILDDKGALKILIELYDTNYTQDWKNTLKGNQEKLKNVYVTLLGATTPEGFREKVSEADTKGGFVARTLVIRETEKGFVNSLMEAPKKIFDPTEYKDYLLEISKLKGEMKMIESVRIFYDKWYRGHDELAKKKNDPTGFLERLNDHVLKTAMLLSLCRSTSMIIDQIDIEMAIELCQDLARDVALVTEGSGKSQFGRQTGVVLEIIANTPGGSITKRNLLRQCYGDVSDSELNFVMGTLTEMGAITVLRAGAETKYVMNPERLKEYQGYRRKVR